METMNFVSLAAEVEGKAGEKFDYARDLLNRHAQEGSRRADYSTIAVQYLQKHQGRRYARGPSLQGLSRSLRKIALESETRIQASYGEVFENFDVDTVNAFMQFLWNELHGVVGGSVDIEYETFTAAVKNPAACRSFLANYLNIPLKAAKKQLIAILHCGRPTCDMPFLWALALELRMATRVVLEQPKFSHLSALFSDRRFPLACRLHYAMSQIEDTMMQDLEQAIRREFADGARVMTYMFDGMVVRFNTLGNGARLQRVLDEVGTTGRVRFTMEMF